MPNQGYITKQRREELHAPDLQEQQAAMQENEQQNLQGLLKILVTDTLDF